MSSSTVQRRVTALEEQMVKKEDTIIQSVLSHFAENELITLINLVDKTGGDGSLLNNEDWMLAELTPQEVEVRNRYATLWYEMGGW
jgi:hypothetical protein